MLIDDIIIKISMLFIGRKSVNIFNYTYILINISNIDV